jgi:cyclic pyranopterin phosphate synthase
MGTLIATVIQRSRVFCVDPAGRSTWARTYDTYVIDQPGDLFGRRLRDLRISVTDRCNFRCVYCMPREVFGKDFQFLQRSALLTFEEIERVATAFASQGVEKLRLTGGEPLLRRDLERLVAKLVRIDGIADVALTTNGALLAKKAQSLADAGLRRVTVSLDSLENDTFQVVNDVSFPVERVLEGIDAALAASLAPVKVNMVVKRGLNDQDVVPMARFFRDKPGTILRFIEYMDVGNTNGWQLEDVVSAAEIVELIGAEHPLEPIAPLYAGEVANRFSYVDGAGEIGVIASVTEPFCGGCTRARLSAEGSLYTCLFASKGHDLRELIRNGASDDELRATIAGLWSRRGDRYSEIRTADTAARERVEMSHIGG